MAKVLIKSADKALPIASPAAFRGEGRTLAYLDEPSDPIRVYQHRLEDRQSITLGPVSAGIAIYVWQGAIDADGTALPAGSSAMIDSGADLALTARSDQTVLVIFAGEGSDQRDGGHEARSPKVHLLPVDRVPRYADGGLVGGLHADAETDRCAMWLHENSMPPSQQPQNGEAGIHSHAEDEVIFVTGGQMRLGKRLYGPGTALAIAAETMYSFTVGPEGLGFINFRPGRPDLIRFKNGMEIDEVGYWRERTERPSYVQVRPAA